MGSYILASIAVDVSHAAMTEDSTPHQPLIPGKDLLSVLLPISFLTIFLHHHLWSMSHTGRLSILGMWQSEK